MHSEGELAGVLSHELAHIQARHIHRRLEGGKMLSVAALAGVLAAVLAGMAGGGGAGAQAMAMGSIAGAKSFELKYSRENEEEADQLGFRYLCSAGYPPKDMSLAMLRLAQGQFVTSSRVPTYLSTHPDLNDRVEYLQDLVRNKEREMKGSKVCSPSASDDFYMVQAALVATYADSQLAVERLQNLSQFSKAAAEYGSARLHLRQGKVAEALPELQDAARKAASCTFVLSSLGGLYLQQGKVADAQKVLQSALLLDPSAPMVHFRLAQVLQEQGRREEALVHLQQIEEHSPIFPAIDMQLGTLLGQMNRMGLAHYHLGRYYELRQDVKNAIFHYEKAKVMLREYPDKMSEVEDSLKELNKRKKESMWEKKT
jgi:predicted Zn-dependent protease